MQLWQPGISQASSLAWWARTYDGGCRKEARGRRRPSVNAALRKEFLKERKILTKIHHLGKAGVHVHLFFSPPALRSRLRSASPRALGCPFLSQTASSQLWLVQENGTLLAANKSPTQERGESHPPGAASEFAVTPRGQGGLRLYFNGNGVMVLWGLGIQEFHQKAVYAHSSLSCPKTSKWWHRTIKIPLFMHFPRKCYNLVLLRAGNLWVHAFLIIDH